MTLLNVIGVPWPYLNEDEVRRFAGMVRDFGQAVERTHQDATTAMANFARAYQGAATQRMQSGWARMSEQHTRELVEGCRVLAEALDVAADYIVAQKVEALAELIAMAATFVADQAASVATLGLAEAAVPLIVATGKKLLETLKQLIIQHIMGEVIEAAAKPLFAKVEKAMSGLDWSQTGVGDGGGGGGGADGSGAGDGFSLDHGTAGAHLQVLSGHAESLRGHAAVLRSGMAGLAF
ncbi:WXG100-like domain-containing protein [Streptacidiphilus sp. PAMC 29251]